MMTAPPPPKKKHRWLKLILKIVGGIVLLVFLATGIASIYVYKKGNDLLKQYLISTVEKSTKGIYHLELDNLKINLFTGRINLAGFHLQPDTALYTQRSLTDTLAPMLVDVRIAKFQVRGFTLKDVLLGKRIDLRKILIDKPEILILLKRTAPKAEKHASNPKMLSIPLPKGLISIEVDLLQLSQGKLTVEDHTKPTIERFSIPSIDITFEHILVDSTHVGLKRILNTDDIRIALNGLEIKTKNGMYTIHPGKIELSTGKSSLVIHNLKVSPNYNRYDFSRKLGYQMDRMEISISKLELQRLDLRQLLINRKFIAGKIVVDGLILDDYRDKRVAVRPNFKPPLLQTALVKAKGYINIDTVQLKNGKATYSEQVGDQPGMVFFDKMEGTIFHVTNDSVLVQQRTPMLVNATMYLMGKGKLNASMRIPLGDPNETFTFSGSLTGMDMTLLNPMVSKMVPAEITSGTIQKMVFANVHANKKNSVGKLDLYYTNLSLKVMQQDDKGWSKFKAGLFSWAGNTFVRDQNPAKNGKFQEGVIYFERDVYKSIFNYLWKSIFSGIKSTIGINKKEQKEIIKEEKKEKRVEKREAKKEERKQKQELLK